jgi:hypothetical protein
VIVFSSLMAGFAARASSMESVSGAALLDAFATSSLLYYFTNRKARGPVGDVASRKKGALEFELEWS